MNRMTARGSTARIDVDECDDIFVGRILGIRAIVSFHGRTVAGLRAEFEHAVDDCLAECARGGVEPDKPASCRLLVRMAHTVRGKAMVVARAAKESLNHWAAAVVERPATAEP